MKPSKRFPARLRAIKREAVHWIFCVGNARFARAFAALKNRVGRWRQSPSIRINRNLRYPGKETVMQFGTKLSIATALLAVCSLTSSASGQDAYGSGPQLFANQYTQGASSQAAQMYLAPQPVPAWVGHTYYTYQPFYPHEMMYRHTDRFHNYYDQGRGLNTTRVHYSSAPIHSAVRGFMSSFSLPRRY